MHQIVGGYALKRIRDPLLNQLRRGQLTELLGEIMQVKDIRKIEEAACWRSILNESDPVWRSFRLDVYDSKRRLLLNLADQETNSVDLDD